MTTRRHSIDLAQLQRLHDDQVIGVHELAVFLNTTEGQIYKLHSKVPGALPPKLKRFGRRLAWRMGTCRDWIRDMWADIPPPPWEEREKLAQAHKGRPRKA